MSTAVAGQVVYEHHGRRRQRRERNPRPIIVGDDGKRYDYLNCAFPRRADGDLVAPLARAVCRTCGHGYGHMMTMIWRVECVECAAEREAERRAWLAAQLGIDEDEIETAGMQIKATW